jgi:hypothetical protein
MPRSKQGKVDLELLGKIKSKVIVYFPDFNGINGFQPAHEETYVVTEDKCDMSNGLISVSVLISNLKLWILRGYKIKTE